MKRKISIVMALVLVISMLLPTAVFAYAEEISPAELVAKSSAPFEDTTKKYGIELSVPGVDGSSGHDEVILVVDGSYSGDDEWNSMVNTIVTIADTVLNGKGSTQLTLMAFGMGNNGVITHASSVSEVESVLGSLPGSLLYGRSSTNCEAGFNGVREYIEGHDDTLENAYVLYISDGEVNTDEHVSNFYDWKNNGWHRFSEEMIITANFEAECGAIAEGANRSEAFVSVFGAEKTIEEICSEATFEQMDRYNAQVWSDVYSDAGLEPNGEYSVSVVEKAFVDYDYFHNTYIQDNFYYALVGRTYPNRVARTKAAAEALAELDQVANLCIIDSNSSTAWMQEVKGAGFIPAGSVGNVISALSEVLTSLASTPFNNVVVTDYMSKWVNLDVSTIRIVDNKTGNVIYTNTAGWLIPEGARPTKSESPVSVELVEEAGYMLGGPNVEGNTNGEIYKLTWTVKDGAMLRGDSYSLKYDVTVDVKESGFKFNENYPAN